MALLCTGAWLKENCGPPLAAVVVLLRWGASGATTAEECADGLKGMYPPLLTPLALVLLALPGLAVRKVAIALSIGGGDFVTIGRSSVERNGRLKLVKEGLRSIIDCWL